MESLHAALVFCGIMMLLLKLFMWGNNICDKTHGFYHMPQIPGIYAEFLWQSHKRATRYLVAIQTSVCFSRNCTPDFFPKFGRKTEVVCPKIMVPLTFQSVDVSLRIIHPVQQGNEGPLPLCKYKYNVWFFFIYFLMHGEVPAWSKLNHIRGRKFLFSSFLGAQT